MVVTPVVFVSFIVSMLWIDYRNTVRRSHLHSEDTPHRMPPWLHHLVFRAQPYGAARAADQPGRKEDGRWYYHSKQKKLLKMEVADAFEIRTTVLAVLALASAAATWLVWRAAGWALGLVL